MVDLRGVKVRETGQKVKRTQTDKAQRNIESIRRTVKKRAYGLRLEDPLADRIRAAGAGSFTRGVVMAGFLFEMLESVYPQLLLELRRKAKNVDPDEEPAVPDERDNPIHDED